MQKGVSFVWDHACQKAFEDIKAYLTKPPILASLVFRKTILTLCKSHDHSLGALLAQKNDKVAEQAIYYLSRILIGAESHTIQSKRRALISSSPSRRYDITWSSRLFMSFQESILYEFL